MALPQLKEGEIYVLSAKAARVQENLMLEVEKAEAEKKQVKMLVSNMSHQLKTHLANIMLYEDLLIGEKYHTQEEKEKFLSQMWVQTEKYWKMRSNTLRKEAVLSATVRHMICIVLCRSRTKASAFRGNV